MKQEKKESFKLKLDSDLLSKKLSDKINVSIENKDESLEEIPQPSKFNVVPSIKYTKQL